MFSMSEVNDFGYEKFVKVFGNVVEKCPVVAATAYEAHPFEDVDELQQCLEEALDLMPERGGYRLLITSGVYSFVNLLKNGVISGCSFSNRGFRIKETWLFLK